MKSISLSGSLRKGVGKKDAKAVRKQGMVPCVMYGGEKECHFLLKEKDIAKVIFTPETYLVNLTVEGERHTAIIQELQYHPVSDKVLHADFYEVSENKPFSVLIPLKYVGTSKGVLRGGKLQKKMRKISVSGLMKDIPDHIDVNISNVDVTTPFRVADLNIPNIKYKDADRTVIACIQATRNLAAEEVAEPEAEEAAGETANA